MRIAYLSGSYVPSRGADSVHVMKMCAALARCGHNVTLHARHGSAGCADDFAFYGVASTFDIIKHKRPQVRVWGALRYAQHVRRSICDGPRPDLIYAREIYSLVGTADTSVPLAFESHWHPKHAVQRELERWVFRRPQCHRIVFISEALRARYKRIYPWLPDERIVVAHDAADLPSTAPHAPDQPRNTLQVAYVGSFFPGYGIDLVAALARTMPHVSFHIVGGGTNEVNAWKRRAVSTRNLRFHGFLPPAELQRLYPQFDVLLAPYQPSTPHIAWISPMKLFEYMSHGKAIACSDFPVMREILSHDVDALLVEATDVGAWRSAIDRLANADLRSRLGTAARFKLEARHTWQARAQSVLAGLELV